MAKTLGKPVIDALIAAGIADENTRRVEIEIDVDGVPVIKVESYADPKALNDVIESVSEADTVRRPVSSIGGCKVQVIRATVERPPVDDWRAYEPADAGAFICDTHGTAVAGTWVEIQRALVEHTAP